MNLLCKIGYHKWEYHNKRVSLNYVNASNCDIEVDAFIRVCDRCYRKEMSILGLKWKKTLFYTKNEERDIKLKSLLGEDV